MGIARSQIARLRNASRSWGPGFSTNRLRQKSPSNIAMPPLATSAPPVTVSRPENRGLGETRHHPLVSFLFNQDIAVGQQEIVRANEALGTSGALPVPSCTSWRP